MPAILETAATASIFQNVAHIGNSVGGATFMVLPVEVNEDNDRNAAMNACQRVGEGLRAWRDASPHFTSLPRSLPITEKLEPTGRMKVCHSQKIIQKKSPLCRSITIHLQIQRCSLSSFVNNFSLISHDKVRSGLD